MPDDSLPASSAPASWRRFLALVGLVLIVLIAAWWLWSRPTAEELLQQAERLRSSNPAAAEEHLLNAIESSGGDYPSAQVQLCELLAAQGRWIEARGAFSLIRDASRCDPAAMARMAQDSLAAGEMVLAQLAAQAIPVHSEHRSSALRVLIELNQRIERDLEVRALATELSTRAPADPFPWQVLALSYRRSQEMNRAIEASRRVIALTTAPEQANPWRENLLDWLLQIEDVAAARQEFDAIPAAAKKSPACLLKQALLLRLEGQFAAARTAVDQVLTQEPRSMGALMLRGVLALDLDRPEQAVADLEASLQAQPFSKESHYKVSQAYRRLGRNDEARQHLAESQRLNKLSEEILVLKREVQQEAASHESLLRLSELHAQLGQQDAARYWQAFAEDFQRQRPRAAEPLRSGVAPRLRPES